MATSDIAVVEDDLSVRRALERLLRGAGFSVRVFASGQELLDSEEGRNAACLVADIHLGSGFNGFEVFEHLLAEGRHPRVIFITAADNPSWRERATQQGAQAFLHKPFEAAVMLDAVRAAVAASAS